MKFVSVQQIFQKAKETLLRFPLPLLAALSAFATLIWMVDHQEKDEGFIEALHLVMTCGLLLPAATGLAIFCERYHIRVRTVWIMNVVLLLAANLYYYCLPSSFSVIVTAQFFILALSTHLWVSFAPFLVNMEIQGFWQYNKSLFLRFLTSVMYAAVLFGGLSLALLAIDQLFEVNLNDKNYLRLFFLISTVFNTWFFLSGFPSEIHEMEKDTAYPNGLRIFTQFVLLPLVTIYLLILYVYEVKILLTADWPRGWVAYLVIGFSTAGILALLLVWPLRNSDRFKWVKAYTMSFFIALFPLILLLVLSIYIRVKEYGLTENRYFIIVLAAWLFINALYFIFSKVKNIKVIPMTLFAFALLSGFGPWNAFEMSRKNQTSRLLKLLNTHHLLENGKFIPPGKGDTLSKEELIRMGGIMDYLIQTHGTESLQAFSKLNLDSLNRKHGDYMLASHLMRSMNLEYNRDWRYSLDNNDQFQFANEMVGGSLKIEGYSFLFKYEYYNSNGDGIRKVAFDSAAFITIDFDAGLNAIVIKDEKDNEVKLRLETPVQKLMQKYSYTTFNVPEEDLTYVASNTNFECKLVFRSIYGSYNQDKSLRRITSLQAEVLYRKVKP